MQKIVVYTAVFGNKDSIPVPLNFENEPNIDYLCFTDNHQLKSEIYKIIIIKPKYKDITKNARKLKILGFEGIKNYDVAIWHDANLNIDHTKISTLALFERDHVISTFVHPRRNCIYTEAIAIVDYGKDYPLRVVLQILLMFLWGYPLKKGLYETSILIVNPSKYLETGIGQRWWSWIKYLSRRDQLSFPYVISRSNVVPGIIPGSRAANEFSQFIRHADKKYYHTRNYWQFLSLSKEFAIRIIKAIIRAKSKKN